MEKERLQFYVFGNHVYEKRDEEWTGEGESYTILNHRGIFVGDFIQVNLRNRIRYFLIRPFGKNWIVLEYIPEYGWGVQRYEQNGLSLYYVSEGSAEDLKKIKKMWNYTLIPWKVPVFSMEFGANNPMYLLRGKAA